MECVDDSPLAPGSDLLAYHAPSFRALERDALTVLDLAIGPPRGGAAAYGADDFREQQSRCALMQEPGATRDDPVAEYMQTFFEWRARYGLADDCMDELRAAVLADSNKTSLTEEQRCRLGWLAQLIEDERRRVLDCAA